MLRRLAKNVTGLTLLPAVAGLLALGACSDSSGPDDGPATLNVLLTDAPGDVDEFWVQILEAYLQGSDGGRVEVLPFDDTRPLVELTSLAGTSTPLAQGVTLDPQTVSQFRIVVGQAAIVTEDGEVYSKDGGLPPTFGGQPDGELRCPSCSTAGYKINLVDGDLTFDPGTNEVMVDFDASQTLAHGAGGSGAWVMHPVLNGMDTDQTGSVQAKITLAPGVVVPDCPPGETRSLEDFRITAVARTLDNGDGDPIRISGKSDSNGDLTIVWVPPDLWDVDGEELEFDRHRLEFQLSSPATLSVTSGSTTQADYVVNAAACASF